MAQNALLRIWKYREKLDDPDRLNEWVSRIARNEALRLLDRKVPIPMEDLDLEAEDDHNLEAVVESSAVRGLLNVLSEDERSLLKLRYEDDMTQSAIAEYLGIPEGTVKIRLYRIREKLRQRSEIT